MRLYSTLYALDSYNINIGGSKIIRIIIKEEINLIEKGEEIREIGELRAAIINLNNSRTRGG
jgi:hypothetical protein